MNTINKTLCELSKKDAKHLAEIKDILKKPKYICKKCYRACSKKDFLCKPTKI